MIIGPKYKICKRLGNGVFEKCQTQKFTLSEARRGKVERKGRRTVSEYGRQLVEMQRVRFTYGLGERQLHRYVNDSLAGSSGDATAPLFNRLEMRLDNAIYRLGFATTRRMARQFVAHRHVLVNGRRSSTPSQMLKVGDMITLHHAAKGKAFFENMRERVAEATPPSWLVFNQETFEGSVASLPVYEQETLINLPSLIEFYSR